MGIFRISAAILVGTMLLFTSAVSASGPNVEFFGRSDALPFAEAVRVGDLLFLSGVIGVKPGTDELVAGGMAAEARQTMENIKSVLEKRGLSTDDVVKCTVMLADISEWPAFNEVYRTYFKQHFPARSAFAGSGLALGARVEVECVAVHPVESGGNR